MVSTSSSRVLRHASTYRNRLIHGASQAAPCLLIRATRPPGSPIRNLETKATVPELRDSLDGGLVSAIILCTNTRFSHKNSAEDWLGRCEEVVRLYGCTRCGSSMVLASSSWARSTTGWPSDIPFKDMNCMLGGSYALEGDGLAGTTDQGRQASYWPRPSVAHPECQVAVCHCTRICYPPGPGKETRI